MEEEIKVEAEELSLLVVEAPGAPEAEVLEADDPVPGVPVEEAEDPWLNWKEKDEKRSGRWRERSQFNQIKIDLHSPSSSNPNSDSQSPHHGLHVSHSSNP